MIYVLPVIKTLSLVTILLGSVGISQSSTAGTIFFIVGLCTFFIIEMLQQEKYLGAKNNED